MSKIEVSATAPGCAFFVALICLCLGLGCLFSAGVGFITFGLIVLALAVVAA